VGKRPRRRVGRAKSFIWKAFGGVWKIRKGLKELVRAAKKLGSAP
jgi:hypothetical protein